MIFDYNNFHSIDKQIELAVCFLMEPIERTRVGALEFNGTNLMKRESLLPLLL